MDPDDIQPPNYPIAIPFSIFNQVQVLMGPNGALKGIVIGFTMDGSEAEDRREHGYFMSPEGLRQTCINIVADIDTHFPEVREKLMEERVEAGKRTIEAWGLDEGEGPPV